MIECLDFLVHVSMMAGQDTELITRSVHGADMSSIMVSLAEENMERLKPLEGARGIWRVSWQHSLELACLELGHGEFDVWLVDELLLEHDPMLWVENVQTHSPDLCVVIFQTTMQGRRDRLTWLELGAYDVVHWDWLRDELKVERLSMLLDSILQRFKRSMESFEQRRLLGRELRDLYRFIHALGGTLDEHAIIAKAMELFLDACHLGAVAYLQLEPGEGQLSEGLDTLFSESEIDGVDSHLDVVQRVYQESSEGLDLSRCQLNVLEQASADRLLVCLGPQMDQSWVRVLGQRHPVLFRRKPLAGEFPGLDPLWHRMEEGLVFFVPIWGRTDPLGIFVVAELAPQASDALMLGAEALFALGSLIGSSLENARHFKQIDDAYQTLQNAQEQLVHAEKFAAVGHLAAQIAHEINNPASFVISNLSVMAEYSQTFQQFMNECEGRFSRPEDAHVFSTLRQEHELDYMYQDLDVLLDRSLSGMQRIHQIVKDLRYFAHDSGPEFGWVDIPTLLDSTLNLVRHEIKYRATLETAYNQVSQVFSDANKLSQVFLNLLVNASQALEHGDVTEDFIRVGTLPFPQAVLVFVEDSGEGMSNEVLPHIFEPFFTTKKRGEGSGLGLSITRDILLSLGGDIRVYSEHGKGTRFEVMIPLKYDMPGASNVLRQSDGYPQVQDKRTPPLPFIDKKKE